MKLWLISQDFNDGYDTCDSAVVASETEEGAKIIHPASSSPIYSNEEAWKDSYYKGWCESPYRELIEKKIQALKDEMFTMLKGEE